MRKLILSCFALLLVLLVDFGFFVADIRQASPTPLPQADAIAALTGARERISAAVQMLIDGKGKRLLISGVNERTSLADLLRYEPRLEHLNMCCVDLGRKATNTYGNAQEIAAWARSHHYQSLWLVTSDYHMPRALKELQQADPPLTIGTWPVPSTHGGGLPPLSDINLWRLFGSEWIKTHIIRLRIALGLAMAENE